MENLTATDYVWFVMLGISIGGFFELIFRERGIGMGANILVGVISSIFGGLVFAVHGLASELLYSAYTSMITLLVINIFYNDIWHQKHPSNDSTTRIIHKYP